MIEKIIDFSARRKFLVLTAVAAAIAAAVWCVKNVSLDAIPDLSDTQVIIYSRWDRSPDVIEDQVTYPIVTALLGAPKVKLIRGVSDFGYSYVYVIFKDGTDLYWARSRTLEYLSKIQAKLPEGVQTEMGPDATSVGWVYQYALVDDSKRLNLAQLRSLQDWYLRYKLQAVPGVAEVASVGGFVKQYQVNIDPNALLSYNIPLTQVLNSIRESNEETGGRVIELSGAEYMVRGRGYAKSLEDLEKAVVGVDKKTGTPILVSNVAKVELGPDIRRGVADLNGEGDAVGGIVVMRSGENALTVIERVKDKLKDLQSSLPPGVRVVPTYDRSDLIERAIATLKHTLTEEMIIVSLVILLFLWHIPSALVPILTIPISVVLAFIPFFFMGLTANIMSLAGIAISIGVLVDGAIIEVENAYKKLQLWDEQGRKGDFHEVRLSALKEVGPSVFFSLLVIAVAFLPVFTLVDQEGRLFKPLAFSKTLALAIASLLAITLDPAMRMLFTRMDYAHFKPAWLSNLVNAAAVGKYYPEEQHPISRALFRAYEPVCRWVLEHRKATLISAALLVASTIPVYMNLGSEFMPHLNEGSILYMPTALPGMAVSEAQRILQIQDKVLKGFPEVESVYGKAGRAETSTDPAPFSMVETTVVLKQPKEWPRKQRWYSSWAPELLKKLLRWVYSDQKSMEELIDEMDAQLRFPGIPNIWTMPIKNRIDMLSTGVRTPIGIKVFGPDVKQIEAIGSQLEQALKGLKGTRNIYAERTAGGYFVDFDLKRDQLARYGLTIKDAQSVVTSAIGGENITWTVEGRERYPVNVRYARGFRQDLESLKRVLVPTPAGAHIPLAELADIRIVEGPSMIRDENGSLAGYVYVDVAGRDVGGYVEEAKRVVERQVKVPEGYSLMWSGQYENMARVKARLKIVIPVTLALILLLLYLNTGSAVETGIVMLAVPFSLVGAVWLLYLLHYNVSIAVWVGMIALMGLDAETGIFMLLFLDLAFEERLRAGKMKTYPDLEEAIIHGAVRRIRPKMMTVMAMFMGLLPAMWSTGAGADAMKRIAAPMVGGIFTSFLLELLIYPVLYSIWKWRYVMKHGAVVPEPKKSVHVRGGLAL